MGRKKKALYYQSGEALAQVAKEVLSAPSPETFKVGLD